MTMKTISARLSETTPKTKKVAFDFLKESGFIGATEGCESDSTDYKKHVTKKIRKATKPEFPNTP